MSTPEGVICCSCFEILIVVINNFLKSLKFACRNKLYNHGEVLAEDLITSFLSYIKQVVDIGGVHSAALEINAGVLQGSILGPLIFLTFVIDLFHISYEPVMHADDNTFQCHAVCVQFYPKCSQKLRYSSKNMNKTFLDVHGVAHINDEIHHVHVYFYLFHEYCTFKYIFFYIDVGTKFSNQNFP
nr:unnamed protein product [Callosobruchus chinensis]